jgi:hypothetical protein
VGWDIKPVAAVVVTEPSNEEVVDEYKGPGEVTNRDENTGVDLVTAVAFCYCAGVCN